MLITHKEVSILETVKIVKGSLAMRKERPSEVSKPYEDPADPAHLKEGMVLLENSVSMIHFGEKENATDVS